MRVILNIGLAREGDKNIGVGTVLGELRQRGFNCKDYSICRSDTEITVAAECEIFCYANPVYFLAQVLGQDCVAVYDLDLDKGYLLGPKAAEWGEFNPEKFILLDGSRLLKEI